MNNYSEVFSAVRLRLYALSELWAFTDLEIHITYLDKSVAQFPLTEIVHLLLGKPSDTVHAVTVTGSADPMMITYNWEEFRALLLQDHRVEQACTEYLLGVRS